MAKNFEIEQLDQDRFVKANNLVPVTNPSVFLPGNVNTSDGLLSNEIFGITKDERSGIYSYIDLQEKFIQPYFYKIWLKIDKNLRAVVYETKTFRIDSNGFLVEDENGETGIPFLIKNIDKIKFKNTKKDSLLKVLHSNKNLLFTSKFVIIPPFYRDVNTDGGRVGLGEINKLYVNLINEVKALSGSAEYGLSMNGGTRGRIQDLMLNIYNWFTIGEAIAGGEHTGAGIFKKFGIMHRAAMSKTTDNSVRLVLSAQKLDADTVDDFVVDMDYSGIPLSASLVIAYPFVLHEMRNFFNNELTNMMHSSDVGPIELVNPLIEFSDDRFDKEINEFLHGYSNRFKPITIKTKGGKSYPVRFKSYLITEEEYNNGVRENGTFVERDLTWVDLFYMIASEVTKDKNVLITRYPVDSYFNQFPTMMRVLSTIETESVVINGKLYKWYPKIRQEDIGTDTSNKFIDTCIIANPYCGLIGADYDGDQVTVKMSYSVEANEEQNKFRNSNGQFITLNGVNGRTAGHEAIQAMYNLTLVLPGTQLTDPVF